MPKIRVFSLANPDRALFHVSQSKAEQLTRLGYAESFGEGQIKLTRWWSRGNRRPKPMLSCGQWIAYEMIGKEPHVQMIQGGLTRTEHKPVIIKPYTGARVGHQP